MSDRLSRLLAERPYLLADGATGTNLFAMGLQSGDAPELWNTEHPERIARLHQMWVEAGSDIILTNSFGGTRYRLKLHQAQDRVAELNEAAARIARQVADAAGREIVVAGSMGPTGELFEPMGSLTFEAARDAFAEQAQALARGGVDVLWIETMSAEDEVRAAVAGAASTGLPVVCTMSFDTNGRTMMGVTPAALTHLCHELHPHPSACGSNCGVGAPEVVAALLVMSAADPQAVLVAKANCGIPEYVDGAIRYNGTPELMAEYARLALDAGARIIGGCCGTRPEHLRAMKAALDGYTPGPRPDVDTIVARLGELSAGSRALLAGEAGGAAPRRGGRRRG
ncbi:MAG TPA: betaine--homocysteine S-methyltransferase [Candidatus Competibacteraceae bacterium]|nr:betaine--homocysteine S-methyltransferase [Candidatus Competibacteraceae bacterium]